MPVLAGRLVIISIEEFVLAFSRVWKPDLCQVFEWIFVYQPLLKKNVASIMSQHFLVRLSRFVCLSICLILSYWALPFILNLQLEEWTISTSVQTRQMFWHNGLATAVTPKFSFDFRRPRTWESMTVKESPTMTNSKTDCRWSILEGKPTYLKLSTLLYPNVYSLRKQRSQRENDQKI